MLNINYKQQIETDYNKNQITSKINYTKNYNNVN